ncbi:hypothetical protein LR48_Vigan38s000300 [Vigna angularis]|uniref:Uncharacterized protein n=1 Tax=Phaseolus angularis TaxID=3914 RepID=A0A0L9T349_PHAAN|nr:hypothetical protein LR48_Vigan38s000300 [Vigna angularis]
MASSSHPSTERGKAVVAARNADLSEWISDEETRLEFFRWMKFKHIVPHKYMNLDLFEKEGFHFQEWIETQGTKHARHLPYVVFISKILTLQGVDVSGEKKCSCKSSNVINRNTLTSIGLVKTTNGWCFKDEEKMVQSSGSTPALNADRTNCVL